MSEIMQSEITQKELGCLEELLRFEEALYEKFLHYAEHAGESATRKLCEQLADRSREHRQALVDCLHSKPVREPVR